VADLLAATLLVQGFQIDFLYAPSSLKILIVILRILLLSMVISLDAIYFPVGCNGKICT